MQKATNAGTKSARSKPAPSGKRGKAPSVPRTKLDIVVGLLRTTKGVTIEDLMEATGWQAHSVRGFLSGALKKKRGLKITSEKFSGGRHYRIAA